jgi:hypothetical protein
MLEGKKPGSGVGSYGKTGEEISNENEETLQPIVTSKNEDVLYFDTKYNSYIYYHIST